MDQTATLNVAIDLMHSPTQVRRYQIITAIRTECLLCSASWPVTRRC